ncbi:hypothetical protein [Hyphomicrobium sp. LHD-15]|uniref:hypothetical protein n=1 Tax=Hyphomicrobium sp. LHD-15 TaxID=3072142 RepID=UPI00280EBA16|nr:hypothetical protein [Hyphomicrobium sp. LHD-15]MDQ8699135.1 hypothetical protein [Hyphomicrobium sp. LHD-15]
MFQNLLSRTISLACGLALALAFPFQDVAAAEPKIKSVGSEQNATSPIGTNLTGVVDWSAEWTFTDPFKQSRPWVSSSGNTWDDGRKLNLDEHGWVKSLLPGQIARTVMYWHDGEKHYPAGKYEVLYDGEGKLTSFPQRITAVEPGKLTLWANPKAGGISLTLEATNPDNYIRNIRIIAPDSTCDGAPDKPCPPKAGDADPKKSLFLPEFLDSIKSYRALRFMDWMDTNNSKITTFDQRPKVTDAHYTMKGVPVEIMVELANTLKADPWFTIPHLADDNYVEKFAEYVRDHLDPDRLVYIEYSNEVWNSIFDQSRYAGEQGAKLGLSSNAFEAQLRFYSRRSVEIFQIWEKVFSGTSRLVRVMASQAANYWVSETVLGFNDAYRSTDALAIAPYLGGYAGDQAEEARVQGMTPEALIAELHGRGLSEVQDWLTRQKEVADRFGVSLIAYEGGQHLVGVGNVVNNERINALFAAANRHPAMKDLYLAYLTQWQKAGGGMFMQFVNTSGYSKWGNWGAREYLNQPLADAPKADALETFIKANPTK